jgi:hypothetical protein
MRAWSFFLHYAAQVVLQPVEAFGIAVPFERNHHVLLM